MIQMTLSKGKYMYSCGVILILKPPQRLVFLWLFVPWLQQELDNWRSKLNQFSKRADKHKVLPHGRPILIFEAAEEFSLLF